MPSLDLQRIWFPEPQVPDPTYAGRTEGHWSWLRRSTIERACDFRAFLNLNLSKLPDSAAQRIQKGLRTSWRAHFFELIVARTLQALGGQVEFEPEIGRRRPDFRATFPSGRTVVVEATSPIVRKRIQEKHRRTEETVNLVEKYVPDGWMASVLAVPDLGPSDSKRELKQALSRISQIPKPSDKERLEVKEKMDCGNLRLSLIPNDQFSTKIAATHLPCWKGDGAESVRKAIKRKRSQVRDASEPVILAINGHEAISEMEDFDTVLFGGEHGYSEDASAPGGRRYEGVGGEFKLEGADDPSISAVLAYVEAGFYCSREPVFYPHPRQKEPLPPEFEVFERRSLLASKGVVRREARNGPVLQALSPVPRTRKCY